MNVAVALLDPNLRCHPDKASYICGTSTLSYHELYRASKNFSLLLVERGIVPGERVLIVLPDAFAFPIAFLGCVLAGAVAVVLGTDRSLEDVARVLKDSGARLLVADSSISATIKAAGCEIAVLTCQESGPHDSPVTSSEEWKPYQPAAGDFAYMLYSSGSTGKPKGIPHRHNDLLLACTLVGDAVLALTANDVIFSVSKFSFAYGLVNSLAFPLFFGATAIIHPDKPSPVALLNIIHSCGPTVLFAVPTIYSQIIRSCTDEHLKLPLRMCVSAGEALPAAIFDEWQRLTGLEIIDGIGSTEMTYIYIANRPGHAKPGSTGQAIPGYQLRLVDDEDNDVPPGNVGNLLVRGETSAPFYLNMPGQSIETMLPDGFVRTGDVFVERDGFYYYQGRNDDMIKSGGQWVSAARVEDVLRGHPAVAECAVVAVSAGGLVKPGAFVMLAPGTNEGAYLARHLRNHVMERLPDFMCPVRFTFVADLPRTATGKIMRFQLRNTKQTNNKL
jgi:benzoate-CoA ligase